MLLGSLKTCVIAACVALYGCATPLIDSETDFAVVMPSPSTSNAEIASAVQELIKTYPVCRPLRALRRIGRPMTLDRHPGAATVDEDAEADLDLLVRLGYLTKTELPDFGKRVFKYERTERGQDTSIIGTDAVCFPAERVLVSVTNVQREIETGGGHLVVTFTHRLDPESIWAQQPDLLKLLAGDRAVLLPGSVQGSVRLSRVWIRSEHPLEGAPQSGALWAVAWDEVHHRFEGGRWGALTLRLWDSE